ncbi:translocation/assembly module TamB domain-containing protein [Reinekea blandensis]|uniref:Translocation and assembly module TamB C-terminal domain-containing protein n=1 Tax=Reinekea blandensis MED297 TaxID=314283 RepID=A4BHU2_9GAMM|nr:translocation/assembly module TamB [Reinekea blandensis]EAR08347.1 hypothetical protein MED297_09411 [Reinekea sp. MED297] [Reinekea blandensis MED297]
MAIHLRTVARHTWITILRVTLMLLILLAIAVAVLVGTEGGRITLLQQGVKITQLVAGQGVTATGIRSPSLGDWRVGELTWQDRVNGHQVQVQDLRLSWQWFYALQNRWWLENLQAKRVTVAIGEGSESAADSGNGLAALYDLWPRIPAIRIERLHVDSLRVERPRYSTLEAQVDAQGEINWGALPLRLLLSMEHADTGNSYALQVSADAIDRVRLQGALNAQPDTVWSQWLLWDLSEAARASWNINIDYSEAGQLTVDIDDWKVPWQNDLLAGQGQVRYDIDSRQLNFNPLAFRLNGKPAELSGWIQPEASELSVQVSQWPLAPFSQVAGLNDDLQGRLSISAQWLGGWREPRLDGEFSATGQWREYPFSLLMSSLAERSALRIADGELALAENRLNLNGVVDWITDEVDLVVDGQLTTDTLIRELLPPALAELSAQGSVNATIQGPVADPNVDFNARVNGQWQSDPVDAVVSGQWRRPNLIIDDAMVYSSLLQADGNLQWQTAEQSLTSEWQVSEWRTELLDRLNIRFPVVFEGSGNGDLQVNLNEGDLQMAGAVNVQGRWQDWPLNADVNIAELTAQGLSLGDSRVSLGERSTTVSGDIRWSEQRLALAFDHQDWPLSTLPPWFGFWPDILSTLEGDWTGQTRLDGLWTRPQIRSDSTLVGQWFGDPLSLTLETDPQTSELWAVPELSLTWLDAQWQYSGDFRPWQLEMDGQAQVEGLHARHLPALSERFTGQPRGLPERMDVSLDADMAIRGRIVSPNLSGQAAVYGALDGEPFELEADIGYVDVSYIDIDQATGTWSDGQWSLDGLVDWRLGQAALLVETESPDVDYLIPWLQLALENHPAFQWLTGWQGSLNGQIMIDNRTQDWLINGDLSSEGVLKGDDYTLQWQGQGRLRQALDHEFSATWADAEATASLSSTAQAIEGDINLQRLDYEQLSTFLPVVPDWLAGVVNGDFTIRGPWGRPDIRARLSSTGQMTLNAPHAFTAHAELSAQDGEWAIGQGVLEFPGVLEMTLDGSGVGTEGQLAFEGLLPETRYVTQSDEIGSGEAFFRLNAQGDLLRPSLDGEVEWRAENQPIALTSQLQTEDDHYQLSSVFYADGLTRIKTNLQVPVQALNEWAEQWTQTPLDLTVALNTPLSVLDPFIEDQPDLRIDGDIQGELTLSGTLQAPQWRGQLDWINGQFEHAGFGSLVDDIQLSLTGEQTLWTVQAQATDGDDGQVSIDGDIRFVPGDTLFGHELSVDLSFADAALLNQAQMDAAVDGQIQATGSYRNLLLAGELQLDPLNIQSDTFLWEGAPQLNIVQAQQDETPQIAERPGYWPEGEWDLDLVVANRASLYGQGISAELAGALSVTDSLYEPVLAGRFELVRGSYTGLGRVFQLTSGSVQIQNSQVVLDIRGEHQTQIQLDGQLRPTLINLRISGTQDALSLTLTSDSGLEQDELLAQLLFGKIVSELDVFQAIQLANVVNKLRTGNSGFDLIGATRDSFDLDSLVFDTESDEQGNLQFNVSAGKYLTNFLYLEVEQNVGTEQEFRGSIQYQVTPNTNLELYTQGEGGDLNDNGIELNWSWDY